MGIPEIADFARNFSVMVRIQGPDPKGLKMRKHAFHHYNSGTTTLSASGVLLPGSLYNDQIAKQIQSEIDAQLLPGFGLVLTVGSVIEPFLSQDHRENKCQTKPVLIPGVQIDVMLEGKMGIEKADKVPKKENHQWQPAKVLKMLDIPASSAGIQSLIETSSGSSEYDWEVGWSLASYRNGPQPYDAMTTKVEQSSVQRQMQIASMESSDPCLIRNSTTTIVFLGVSLLDLEDLPILCTSSLSKRGDLLLVMGSPFGILSPLHFFNRKSKFLNQYISGIHRQLLSI